MRVRAFLLLAILLGTIPLEPNVVARQRPNTVAISPAQNESAFLMLSDIHFDPFTGDDASTLQKLAAAPVEDWERILRTQADQPFAPDGADTNYSLLLSALDAARDSGVHYDYVLVMGDFLGHNFPEKYRRYCRPDGEGYEEFVIKTIAFVSRTIQHTFPSIPVYATFGNNDSLSADYGTQGPGLLAAMQKEWKVIGGQASAKKDFLEGGYYAVPHPTVPDFEFIVLNTSYWSSRSFTSAATDADSAELKWLAAQLDEVRRTHKSAAMIMHIPPGIDAYASSKPGQCAIPTSFWKKPVMDSFLAIVSAHKDVVRDGFAGHTHIDDFRVFTDASGMAFFQTHIAPSISRDHHNPPGFEIGLYDKQTGAMVDYAADYLTDPVNGASTKPEWKLAYDFREQARLADYSPASLEGMTLLIRSSETVRNRLMRLYGNRGLSTVPINARDWRYYSCAETELEAASYSTCACPNGGN